MLFQVFGSEKLQEAESLLDFVQSATKELKWMSDKEDVEISRDWSAKNLNLIELEHYQEVILKLTPLNISKQISKKSYRVKVSLFYTSVSWIF